MMAGIPFMASAADTLDMKASLAEGTCTIEGGSLNGNIDFGVLTKAEYNSDYIKSKVNEVKFSGCPSSIKQVLVSAQYDGDGTSSTIHYTGTAKGFELELMTTGSNYLDSPWLMGETKTVPIVNGYGFLVEQVLLSSTHIFPKTDMGFNAGSFNAAINLESVFE
ncbi:hypothetical protein BIW59_25690 [Salmonella enterica]|nr:hypothetical protein [Salmonella enterica]